MTTFCWRSVALEKRIRRECSKDLSTRVVDKFLLRTKEEVRVMQFLVELSRSRGRYPVREEVLELVRALHNDREWSMAYVDLESHTW